MDASVTSIVSIDVQQFRGVPDLLHKAKSLNFAEISRHMSAWNQAAREKAKEFWITALPGLLTLDEVNPQGGSRRARESKQPRSWKWGMSASSSTTEWLSLIRQCVSDGLGVAEEDVEEKSAAMSRTYCLEDVPFGQIGLTSAGALVLRDIVLKELHVTPDRLPLTLAFDFPTLRKLTTFLQDAQGQPASSTEPVWRTGAVESLFLHVGVQCITASLADGSHHQQFLQTAVIGCDAAVETPLARWDVNSHGNDTVSVTRHGSFLTEIDLFDAAHFEMSFAEAAVIDPGQRLVLQCAGEVLPHTDARDCSASCAVVVAQFHNDWSLLMGSCSGTSPSSHASAAVCACIAANRVSFSFDLHGPSFAVDTACSSALVAEPHQHWPQQSTSCCTPRSFDTTAAQDCFRAVAAVAASMPVQMATAGRRLWELFISAQGDRSWKLQQSLAPAAVRASQRPAVVRSRSFCMKLWNKHADRCGGVSSFGFGGTLAHALLSFGATAAQLPRPPALRKALFRWSAHRHPFLETLRPLSTSASLAARESEQVCYRVRVTEPRILALLKDHVIFGEIVVPAAAFLEFFVAGLAAHREGPAENSTASASVALGGLGFFAPMVLAPDSEEVAMELSIDGDGSLEISSHVWPRSQVCPPSHALRKPCAPACQLKVSAPPRLNVPKDLVMHVRLRAVRHHFL
eukprot:s2749_g10.t1